MEMNFSDLRKRKEHGVRKTMENQKKRSKTLKKKTVPLSSYRKFRNIKTKKKKSNESKRNSISHRKQPRLH